MALLREYKVLLPQYKGGTNDERRPAYKNDQIMQADGFIRSFFLDNYGGWTKVAAFGQWKDEKGVIHNDYTNLYTVAFEPTSENERKFIDACVYAGFMAGELAVYICIGDGTAHIRECTDHKAKQLLEVV